MTINDFTLTEAVKHIQENIQPALVNLNVDVNNLFEIICELQIENEALKAEFTIAKGTNNSAGKAEKAELRRSMATKFEMQRGAPIRSAEEEELINCINKVVDRVVPLEKIEK